FFSPFLGWHGGAVGSTVALQQEGPGFDSRFSSPHVYVPLSKALNLKHLAGL
ncbi:hypothetical protein ATANTOWER_017234, partial [Ataeniobius toweri]|nr:hypothetical protein [Ataeniobius toweri]